MMRRLPSALAVLTVGAGSAIAAETGPAVPLVCMKGLVFDGTSRACVKADDDALLARGRELIEAGHYGLAVAALESVGERQHPMALTMLGHATRKMGRINDGIALFREALALDPENAVTRGYLGETYVFIGRIDLATGERDRIEAICGTGCKPYVDLQAQINRESGHPPLYWHRRTDW